MDQITGTVTPVALITRDQSHVDEGDAANFTITLNKAAPTDLTVHLHQSDTPTGEVADRTRNGTVTIAKDASSVRVSITTVDYDDQGTTGSVTMTLTTSGISGYTVNRSQMAATVAVRDLDSTSSVSPPPGTGETVSLLTWAAGRPNTAVAHMLNRWGTKAGVALKWLPVIAIEESGAFDPRETAIKNLASKNPAGAFLSTWKLFCYAVQDDYCHLFIQINSDSLDDLAEIMVYGVEVTATGEGDPVYNRGDPSQAQ